MSRRGLRLLTAGVDEVGRGPLAGPVVAAAVVLLRPVSGVADSKTLTAERRRELAAIIRDGCAVGVGAASVAEIERHNILGASMLAMRRAVLRLSVRPGLILVDGNRAPPLDLPCRCVVGGDATVPEIGAASIVAKVVRDALMARLAQRHPGYGWERNAGYPTPEHLAALSRLGLCLHHRRGFAPCARVAVPVTASA
jgi:ribonuclease HII